jgi:hypothetical protein
VSSPPLLERSSIQRDRQSEDGGGRTKKKDKKKHKKCKKQRFRDYFIESNGCRSKRPYKMAKCVASSGAAGSTCVANKTILRKIRFVCKNGRKFKKEVEIIRRCGRAQSAWKRR